MACACKKGVSAQPTKKNFAVKRTVPTANGRRVSNITRRVIRRTLR